MSEEVLDRRVWGQLARALGKRRWLRTVAEAGYDAAVWIFGRAAGRYLSVLFGNVLGSRGSVPTQSRAAWEPEDKLSGHPRPQAVSR